MMFKKSESGRNVVEMIGIIVLMVLLIAFGLWGFKKASLSAKVNTMTKDMSTAITERRYQIAQGGTNKKHTLDTKVGSTQMKVENETSGSDRGQFTIVLSDQDKDTCEEMKKFNIFTPEKIMINDVENGDCAQVNAMAFYFDPRKNGNGGNGGDDPLGGLKCPAGNVTSCSSGEYKFLYTTLSDGKECYKCEACLTTSCPSNSCCSFGTDAITGCEIKVPRACNCATDAPEGYVSSCTPGSTYAEDEQTLADGTTKCYKCEDCTTPTETICSGTPATDSNNCPTQRLVPCSGTTPICGSDGKTCEACTTPTETICSGAPATDSNNCPTQMFVPCSGTTPVCGSDGKTCEACTTPTCPTGCTCTDGTDANGCSTKTVASCTCSGCNDCQKCDTMTGTCVSDASKTTCGECGNGTCTNGSCNDPGKTTETFYHLVEGVCTNSAVSYCPGSKPATCTPQVCTKLYKKSGGTGNVVKECCPDTHTLTGVENLGTTEMGYQEGSSTMEGCCPNDRVNIYNKKTCCRSPIQSCSPATKDTFINGCLFVKKFNCLDGQTCINGNTCDYVCPEGYSKTSCNSTQIDTTNTLLDGSVCHKCTCPTERPYLYEGKCYDCKSLPTEQLKYNTLERASPAYSLYTVLDWITFPVDVRLKIDSLCIDDWLVLFKNNESIQPDYNYVWGPHNVLCDRTAEHFIVERTIEANTPIKLILQDVYGWDMDWIGEITVHPICK